MLFHESVLQRKQELLDAILRDTPLLERVLREFAPGEHCTYQVVPRPWQPGGGSTLFALQVGERRCFLKVKRLEITVESRLESEPGFSPLPSLRNEFEFLERLRDRCAHTPRAELYLEQGGFGFLFLEPLLPFARVVPELGATELVDVYEQLRRTLKLLFELGIAHTDVHEHNVLFRGRTPVLCDFEEARWIAQGVAFEESLDAIGANRCGDVGDMPAGPGILPGKTCLARLRQVICALLLPRARELAVQCRFDSSCPFLTALDHGTDERVYQSIQLPGWELAGQRPLDDRRLESLRSTLESLYREPIVHVDIGSNLGRFNVELAKHPLVARSIGVEASQRYVDLARCLALLADAPRAEFICAEAGRDSIADLLSPAAVDLVTVYSVYHHIRERAAFLADLRRLRPRHVLLELATQPECYEGRAWGEELRLIARALDLPQCTLLGRSEDYDRPLILMASRASAQATLHTRTAAPVAAAEEMPAQPQVSVVLPTYNQVEYLGHAVQSLLAQTFREFELIVVNDGSSDGTRAYLDGLEDPRVRVIHQENQGLPRALNTGFAAARAELWTWISSDNSCAPIFLEALVGALAANPDAAFAYSAFAWIDERDRITAIQRDQDFGLPSLLASNPGNASFLYRRACHAAVGDYDAALEGAEDWDMWLRICERFPSVYVPELLYYYRSHARSMTAQKQAQVVRASRQVVRNALQRTGGIIDFEKIYPSLAQCQDVAAARLHACLDLGQRFAGSPFHEPAIAALIFEQALAEVPDCLEAAANLALLRGRMGEFEPALAALPSLERSGEPRARELCASVREAARQHRPELLGRFAFAAVDPARSELLRLAVAARRTFSLTQSWASSNSA